MKWIFLLASLLCTSNLSTPFVYGAPMHDIKACSLEITIIAAPFAVVDSNKPGVQGPGVATLGVIISNRGATAVQNLQAAIGNGVTPGIFTPSGGKSLALLGQEAATRNVATLNAGESASFYWLVTYPATFNVSYPYTVWVTTNDGCNINRTSQLVTQSQISASANKLLPKSSILLVAPNEVLPGKLLMVKIIGFDLGTIGQGPKDQNPYNAWLQPIGNLDFDPSCLRLVRTEVLLKSIAATPFINQLYFEGLSNYRTNLSDYVTYTFAVLRQCSTNVLPYQQAASGTQEKYNDDYNTSTTGIQFTSGNGTNLQLALNADKTTIVAGDKIQLTTKFSAKDGQIGTPLSGNPAIITVALPPNTTFVVGSAQSTLPANLEYSTDNGVTWQATLPSNPATITHLHWVATQTITKVENQITFNVAVSQTYSGETLTATATGNLMNAPLLASSTVVCNGPAPTATPTPSPTPTVGNGDIQNGGNGGLESGPLPGTPSAFLGEVGNDNNDKVKAAARQQTERFHKARLLAQTNVKLEDVLPATGPTGTTPTSIIPGDVLAITDAPDAKAINFVNDQGKIKGVALGILTMDKPYEHDYGVCNRFKEYAFDTIEPLTVTLPSGNTWFWHGHSHKDNTLVEDAIVLNVFVDEATKQFHIDSHWVKDSYPATFDFHFDYVFNMQVWSANLTDSETLLAGVLNRLSQIDGGAWQIIYHNQVTPIQPQIYIRQALYHADEVQLKLENASGDTQSVHLYGAWRSHLDRNTLQLFDYTLDLPSNQSDLTLAFPGLLDVTVYVESNGFLDKIYTGSGLWFSINSTDGPQTQMTLGQCRSLDGVDTSDLLLAGCVEVTTPNLDAIDRDGVGRTLNPNGREVDISPYKALRFWAQGDGTPVRILLESAGITDRDYYQTVFTPDSTWRQYIIPLRQFTQRGFGAPKSFLGTDTKAVIWLNAAATGKVMHLALDQITFTNRGLLTLVQQLGDSADTTPRQVQVLAPDGVDVAQVLLYYSVDGGTTFITRSLNLQDTTVEGARFGGELPGQAVGSDVMYYIEVQQSNGYISNTPLDAPTSVYRYRIDDRKSLLVDDFAAPQLLNRLNGGPGFFNDPTAGGHLSAYRQTRQLVLDYDVSQANQVAGYFTALANLDARPFTTIDLLVRGEIGGEAMLVGLRDTKGTELRLSLGDLWPGGITQNWQWVQIPLSSFSATLDRSTLANLSLSFFNSYTPSSGRIYVKEIRFTNLATPLVIDSFDDANLASNGQGLGYWTALPNSSLQVTTTVGDALYSTGNALSLRYTVNAGGYTIWHSNLANVNAPANSALQLWVKGANQAITPTLYLTNGDVRTKSSHQVRIQVALADYVKLSDSWQLVSIPLTDFTKQGLDATRLSGFEVVFEHGKGSGVFWLDNVRIGVAGASQAERRVFYLTDQAHADLALHLPDTSRWQAISDVGWLSTRSTGVGPATLSLDTLPWVQPPGVYGGNLIVTSANGQAETITLHFTVTHVNTPAIRIFMPTIRR